jgi:hypothetical protein
MMLIAVVSLKGSPGVTTFCVALAARWPVAARVLLVEADPSGGDVATRFSLAATPGLPSLAVAARRSSDPDLVWRHTQVLPGGLPVVTAPPDADRAQAALSALATDPALLRSAADDPRAVVIADCGRIDHRSAAMPILRCADIMVLLTRARADDLAHLAQRLPSVGSWSPCPVLILLGDGYPAAEVARELGVSPLAHIPEDRHGAAVLCGRPPGSRWNRRGPSRSALGRSAHRVATALARRQPATAPEPNPAATRSHLDQGRTGTTP